MVTRNHRPTPTAELRIPCEGIETTWGWIESANAVTGLIRKRYRPIDRGPCHDLAEGQSVYFVGESLTPEVHFWCAEHLEGIKTGDVASPKGWVAACLYSDLED